jgi:hypothetical protein
VLAYTENTAGETSEDESQHIRMPNFLRRLFAKTTEVGCCVYAGAILHGLNLRPAAWARDYCAGASEPALWLVQVQYSSHCRPTAADTTLPTATGAIGHPQLLAQHSTHSLLQKREESHFFASAVQAATAVPHLGALATATRSTFIFASRSHEQ